MKTDGQRQRRNRTISFRIKSQPSSTHDLIPLTFHDPLRESSAFKVSMGVVPIRRRGSRYKSDIKQKAGRAEVGRQVLGGPIEEHCEGKGGMHRNISLRNWTQPFPTAIIILFQSKGRTSMKKEQKEGRDDDFTPKDIRKRASYRKISEEIKNYMAKLYYVEEVKMSRLVKKYNISFSTITDILKKYDSNGDRILPENRQHPAHPTQEASEEPEKAQLKSEVKTEYVFPEVCLQLESPHNPEYVYYDN